MRGIIIAQIPWTSPKPPSLTVSIAVTNRKIWYRKAVTQKGWCFSDRNIAKDDRPAGSGFDGGWREQTSSGHHLRQMPIVETASARDSGTIAVLLASVRQAYCTFAYWASCGLITVAVMLRQLKP